MIIFNTYYNLSVKTPTHVTISNWIKKVGYYHIEEPKEKAEDWIIIIDESIQIGQEKLLLILGVRESKIDFKRALNYKDIVVVLQVSKPGWNSSEIGKEIRKAEKILGKIKYAVSDNGPSIVKALISCHIPQIHDITHRAGNILKKAYKNEDEFIELTKQANTLRNRIQQTKWAFLLPPNQRSKSRFLNLKPIILWAVKMLKYLKNDLPEDFPYEKFAWLKKYENIINELNTVILAINQIFTLLKNNGMNISTVKKSKKILGTLISKRTKKIKEELILYFQECSNRIQKTKKILCTSDIIESCFGKYKNNISKNSLCGITNISLFIPASTCETGIKEINKIMESVKIENIKEWTENNIGQSLLKKRRDAFNLRINGTKKKIAKRA